MRTAKKSLKILLTEKGDSRETPVAPVTLPSPRSTFRRLLSYPRAGKSQRGVPVSAQLEKEAVNSLELDREVIRCKTCGLVQYRTRTGNCRRSVRALPQRLEFLIPPPAPAEETRPQPAHEHLANRETVENIGHPTRPLRESRSMPQTPLQSPPT